MKVLILFFISVVYSFKIEIPVNGYRCVSEEAFEGQIVHGKYSMAEGFTLQGREMEFKIFDEEGEEKFAKKLSDGEKGSYALTPDDDGDLDFCFIDTSLFYSKIL